MGGASGSAIAEQVWAIVQDEIPPSHTLKIAKAIIAVFENADCDTIYEAEDLCHAAGRKIDGEEG
jgi:hypothetical protein